MANMYAESLRAFLKPILPYLDDEAVSEIMINGPEDIWIEKKGKVFRTDVKFTDEGLLGAARNMAQFVGRVLNDERPRLDARLPDGSRIHVVLPPIARKGTTISIRKFFKDKLTIDKLVDFGSMTTAMARFIEGCVRIKENIVVAGGTGSGKTTLLNIVSSLIPNDERILTIEDSAELQLNQDHLVPFESRPPDKFGKGEVNMGHLLHSALRLRPDRIVVGEVRGGEAFDLMQAMNTGHGGSMATTHANTPTDTLRRLESLCLMSGIELPMVAVRAQVASAINVIITCERLQDGSRKTTAIAEVLPLNDKGDYRTQDIFVFTPTHKDEDGKIHGYHAPTGVIPNFIGRLHAYGFTDMTEEFFDPDTYNVPPPPIFNADHAGQTRWVKKLKYREEGKSDSDEQAQKWAEARLAKGKEVERAAREAAAKKAAEDAAKKAVEAAGKPPEPTKPASAPAAAAKPAAPAPAEPRQPPAALRQDSKPATPAAPRPESKPGTPAPAPAMAKASPAAAPAAKKPETTNGSIAISEDLLQDGEVEHHTGEKRSPFAEAEGGEGEESGDGNEDTDYPPPAANPALRRPGPSRPAPSGLNLRKPGPSRPAPPGSTKGSINTAYGRKGGEADEEESEYEDNGTSENATVIRAPRR
jgi:pilus assembly protein CpaF